MVSEKKLTIINTSNSIIAILASTVTVVSRDYTLLESIMVFAVIFVTTSAVGLFFSVYSSEDLYSDLIDQEVIEPPGTVPLMLAYSWYPYTLRDDIAELERKVESHEARNEHMEEKYVAEVTSRLSQTVEKHGYKVNQAEVEDLIRSRLNSE